MRLTPRGRIVFLVVILALAWGVGFGLPALMAIVVLGTIALVGAVILVRRASLPTVERRPVAPGFPGETREAELVISDNGSLPVEIGDTVPTGIRPVDDPSIRTMRAGRLRYRFVSDRRGVTEFGPVRVELTDPLGLVKDCSRVDTSTEVVTYPRRRSIEDTGGALAFDGLYQTGARRSFDQLREYDEGDALRDVHWPSSAKQPDEELIVKEYRTEADRRSVRIVAASAPKHADALASAAASVALELLENGVEIALETADCTVPVGCGPRQRHRVLTALARTNGGSIHHANGDGATIAITADRHGVSIEHGERITTLEAGNRRTGRPLARRSGP